MYCSNIVYLKKLEELGYNLQCIERPMAMIYESYRRNSMYYLLLFREISSMYKQGLVCVQGICYSALMFALPVRMVTSGTD